MAALSEALGALRELALGQRCPACGAGAAPERVLCAGCWEALPRWRARLCARCVHEGRDPLGCRRHAGHGVWAALVWEERVAAVVHALKYRQNLRVACSLAAEMAAGLPGRSVDLVVEVPLHPARERERGYNQAAVLALALARRIGAPFSPGVMRRVRATRTQTALDPVARARNVAGAFRVAEPAWVGGRRVLLVDDVFTTGATISECAGALRTAGARVESVAVSWVQ